MQKMQMSHRPVRWLAVMLLVIFTVSCQCQQNQSRRAVTEHQLMHDRGRNIQSLKRLIWLSSAIEGLHTASWTCLPGKSFVTGQELSKKKCLAIMKDLRRTSFVFCTLCVICLYVKI
uniref:Uncharacterized protein n=1 Tax=Salarias fasciatus TaxID=181472 RepID=A0A672GN24_SALFA